MGKSCPAGDGHHAGEHEMPDPRRAFSMRRSVQRACRWVLLVAFLGLLGGAPAVPLLGNAWARPYPVEPGPEPTNGDPTGDDRPSPTPKSANRAASFRQSGGTAARRGNATWIRFESWRVVLRYLVAISLR